MEKETLYEFHESKLGVNYPMAPKSVFTNAGFW